MKLIVLFFTALWLFGKGGEILGYLKNITLAEQVRHANGDSTVLRGEEVTAVNLTDLQLTSGFASILGLVVGLIVSLIICKKRNWHWLNPVLSSIIVYLIGWVKLGETNFIARLLRLPGEMFDGVAYYLINGLVCILLALLIFVLMAKMKYPNNYISDAKLQSA
ncbi:MAG: hypothetical protein EOO10_22000 [Chitinophagaceae bacterium]|nr:MAG: hypothetical protein EOO10_22000 [Chitinophagaceae bacterium]